MEAKASKQYRIRDTKATRKIFKMRARIRAVSGGTSASKTTSILIWLIDCAQASKDRKRIISVASESMPHLQAGAMRDFKTIMQDRGYWDEKRWSETRHAFTFKSGSVIEFISPDTYNKAHGPRRDILFLNEGNHIDWKIADQLIARTREVIWIDWNPVSEFWFYTEIQGRREDVDFITLTYLDNDALDEGTINEILSHQDIRWWWRVYAEGQLGESGNRIFTDWRIIDEVPKEARLERYGLDFGYSQSPTALIALYFHNGGYIVDEILFSKGLSNQHIAEALQSLDSALVVADAAEPKSIEELRLYRIQIAPSSKGKGSRLQRIQYTKAQRISVTKRSVNVIKEYRNYMWSTDRTGNVINEPEHPFSHSMDAISYAIQNLQTAGARRLREDKIWIDPKTLAQEQRAEYYRSTRRRPERGDYELPGLS